VLQNSAVAGARRGGRGYALSVTCLRPALCLLGKCLHVSREKSQNPDHRAGTLRSGSLMGTRGERINHPERNVWLLSHQAGAVTLKV